MPDDFEAYPIRGVGVETEAWLRPIWVVVATHLGLA
jgi:hypothetical protein